MSSFYCCNCGAAILDSDTGYTTGCKHYPLERKKATVEKKSKATISYVHNNLKGRIEALIND